MHLLSIFFLLSSALAIPSNPCAGKPQNCQDENSEAGCKKLFPNPLVDCLDDDLQDEYVSKCRKTCSRCCEDPKFSSCSDNNPDLCTDFNVCTLMPDTSFKNCQSTCGQCDQKEPTCTDHSTECPRYQSQCKIDTEVTMNCPKTCKTCGIVIPTTTVKTTIKVTTTTKKVTTKPCYDADEACPSWVKNGFCSNPDASLKEKYCAKSCGYCK